tara:strand:+ start:11 stop:325 length:315 start_codon:yes stop_codon:yes gene_type:complete
MQDKHQPVDDLTATACAIDGEEAKKRNFEAQQICAMAYETFNTTSGKLFLQKIKSEASRLSPIKPNGELKSDRELLHDTAVYGFVLKLESLVQQHITNMGGGNV